MYVHSVTLENLKGFKELKFDLARPDGTYAGWTVFTGGNGSGKSTLLKAIAIGLVGRDIARSLQPSFRGWIRGDAMLFPAEASVQLEVVRTPDDELKSKGKAPNEVFPAKLAFEYGMKDVSIRNEVPLKKPKNYQTPDRTIWSTNANGWFSCGYGPFRRVFGASSEVAQIMVSPATARFATMFQEAASLLHADQWIRELHYKSIEDQIRVTPDDVEERRILDTLLILLRDEFMPSHLTLDRVDSDGVWLKDSEGIQFAWSDMSDGYRAALALLIDIFRHLVATFGLDGLTGVNDDGKLQVIRSGVVLIDEIDAHLHPAWQQKIGFWLKEHFPCIQFLVTTHSPMICQAADPHGLFVLPELGSGEVPHRLTDDEYNRVIASRPDTILTSDAFGLQNTRSSRAVEARAKLARIASKQSAGGKLTPGEKSQWKELSLFQTDEEL